MLNTRFFCDLPIAKDCLTPASSPNHFHHRVNHLNFLYTLPRMAAKAVACLLAVFLMAEAQAVTIDAIYFAQTHAQKATDP